MNRVRSALGIAALWLLAQSACRAQETITVTYSERPPYMLPVADGAPTGLTGSPAATAFKAAGVNVVWRKLPTNRQLAMVREQVGMNCAIGWFWTPEREQFAKFSKPIYRDKDWAVLANATFAARGYATLDEIVQHRETRILVKDNYSYGAELDKLLARLKPTLAVSAAPTGKMVQSISKGAVDLMFVSEDEGNYIMAHGGEQTASLRLLRFKDMPHGPERHIMCSKNVPDDVIARLNKAIAPK